MALLLNLLAAQATQTESLASMSGHTHVKAATRLDAANTLTKQPGVLALQALSIGKLGGVVPSQLLELLLPSLGAVGVEDGLGIFVAHGTASLAPKVVDSPVLLILGSSAADTIGEEDFLESGAHVKVLVGKVEKDEDLVSVGEGAAPDVSLADTPLVLGDVEVASDTLNGAASGVLVDGDNGRVGDNSKVRS